MQLHDLKPAPGSTHRRKKVGRGPGSGHGKTSTRGHKGDKARGSGNPNFEGGQTPLHRRLPQTPGFKAINKTIFAVVNVAALDSFEDGTEITPILLVDRGLARDLVDVVTTDDEGNRSLDIRMMRLNHIGGVKILGDGEIKKKLTVHAHKFSKSAREKLEAAGGSLVELDVPGKTKQQKGVKREAAKA